VPEVRVDPVLGTVVHVVSTRQTRPNRPPSGCPFCVGGIEAPEPYDVRWFPNRWPAMDGGRCEVVLYTPDHDATFWQLGVDGARKVVDLWADRTAALGAREDEVGATIDHPHGQIYAYDHVPRRQSARLLGGWQPDADPDERMVVDQGSWFAWVPFAPTFPLAIAVAPRDRFPDLPSAGDKDRDILAGLLVDLFRRLDLLYPTPLPYMMWLNQRPTVDTVYEDAWFNIEIVSPWRSAGVQRFIAAAEVASEEYFNPVLQEEVAASLRAL
jgi:UDPglucose--hexose-1-phosphate uridylyltransferase